MFAFGFVGMTYIKPKSYNTIAAERSVQWKGRERVHAFPKHPSSDGVTPHVISFIVDIIVEEKKLIRYISLYYVFFLRTAHVTCFTHSTKEPFPSLSPRTFFKNSLLEQVAINRQETTQVDTKKSMM